MALRDEAEHNGEQLTPYSFRHRYAKGMHAANLPLANIAEAMGHTIEVHLKSYARFKPNATAELIAAVNV
jgi:integrase